jgi:hypothetical protein
MGPCQGRRLLDVNLSKPAAAAACVQVIIAMLVGQLQLQLHPSVGGWQGLLQRRMYHTTLQVEGGLPVLLRPRAAH